MELPELSAVVSHGALIGFPNKMRPFTIIIHTQSASWVLDVKSEKYSIIFNPDNDHPSVETFWKVEESAASEFLLKISFDLSGFISRNCAQLCADSAHGVSLDKLTLNFVEFLRQISASFGRTAAVSSVLC